VGKDTEIYVNKNRWSHNTWAWEESCPIDILRTCGNKYIRTSLFYICNDE